MIRLSLDDRELVLFAWGDARRAREASPGAVVLASARADDRLRAWELRTVDGAAVVLVGDAPEGAPILVAGRGPQGLLWVALGVRLYLVPADVAATSWVEWDAAVMDVRATNRGAVVVVLETGVVSVDAGGRVLWSVDTGLVIDVAWRHGVVEVGQLDGPSLELDLVSGTAVERRPGELER